MAEKIEAGDVQTETGIQISFGYEEYLLTTEAAILLRDQLNDFLR